MIEIMNIRDKKPCEQWDFYIDRRSPVGNPNAMQKEEMRDKVCEKYEVYFARMVESKNQKFCAYLKTLGTAFESYGKLRLFCWCAPKRCHGETIKAWLGKTA